MSAQFYKMFQDSFVPRMFELASHSFQLGSVPSGWQMGLLNCIPKTAGASSVGKLHLIALQDVKKK